MNRLKANDFSHRKSDEFSALREERVSRKCNERRLSMQTCRDHIHDFLLSLPMSAVGINFSDGVIISVYAKDFSFSAFS